MPCSAEIDPLCDAVELKLRGSYGEKAALRTHELVDEWFESILDLRCVSLCDDVEVQVA